MKDFIKRALGIQALVDVTERMHGRAMGRIDDLASSISALAASVAMLRPRPYVIVEGVGVVPGDGGQIEVSWGKHADDRQNGDSYVVQFQPQHLFRLDTVLSLGPYEITNVMVGNRILTNQDEAWPSMHRWKASGGNSTCEVGNIITVQVAAPSQKYVF